MHSTGKSHSKLEDFLTPQNNKVSSEREFSSRDVFIPLSLGRKQDISKALKDSKIPKTFLGIKVDLFTLKNEDLNFVNMGLFDKDSNDAIPEKTEKRVLPPLETYLNPQIRQKPKSPPSRRFLMPTSTNHYEKYFPKIASNITIPTGPTARYISAHLNDNEGVFLSKPIKSSDPIMQNSKYSNDSLLEGSQNFFFKQSLMEQKREVSKEFKSFKGVNRVKPELTGQLRNQEFLKVTKSLLMANNNKVHELKPENNKLLGVGTQDLFHLSKFIDPELIKDSIVTDNANTYPDIQVHFGLEKEGLREKNRAEDDLPQTSRFSSRTPKESEKAKNRDGFSLQGKRMKTKAPEVARSRPRKRKMKEGILSLKMMNFKLSQNKKTPIADSMKKLRSLENERQGRTLSEEMRDH